MRMAADPGDSEVGGWDMQIVRILVEDLFLTVAVGALIVFYLGFPGLFHRLKPTKAEAKFWAEECMLAGGAASLCNAAQIYQKNIKIDRVEKDGTIVARILITPELLRVVRFKIPKGPDGKPQAAADSDDDDSDDADPASENQPYSYFRSK